MEQHRFHQAEYSHIDGSHQNLSAVDMFRLLHGAEPFVSISDLFHVAHAAGQDCCCDGAQNGIH